MPEDIIQTPTEPAFEEKKIRAPRKRSAVSRRTKKTPAPQQNSFKEEEINECLNSIYKDDRGSLPNMKEIKIKKTSPLTRLFTYLLVMATLAAVAIWAGFFFFPSNSSFADSAVSVSVDGPTSLTLGTASTYTVSIHNDANIALSNATLRVNYPSGFVFSSSSLTGDNAGHTEWALDDILPHSAKNFTITGIPFSKPSTQGSWRVFLTYQPANLKSDLQKAVTLTTSVVDSPIKISITGPDTAPIGKDIAYTFTVKKPQSLGLSNLELAPVLPSNFIISSSSPALGKNNKWTPTFTYPTSTASAPAVGTATFIIRGKLTNSADTTTTPVRATLNANLPTNDVVTIAEAELGTVISQNSLNFNIAVNGSTADIDTKPDDTLNITVRLQNTSKDSLKDAVMSLALEAPSVKKQSALNWSAIVDKADGDIQGEQLSDVLRRGTIVWNAKKIPALAKIGPGQEVAIDIQLPVKSTKDFAWEASQGNAITLTATASFTDASNAVQTIAANPIVATIGSDLAFEEQNTITTTSEGKEQHAISWIIKNSFHPLKNISLSATLFGDVAASLGTADAGTATFDPASKNVTWKIREMPASVDVLSLPFTVIVQSKNPSQSTLVSKVHIEADDALTGKHLDFMSNEIPLGAH